MALFRRIIEVYEAQLVPVTLNSFTERAKGKVERGLFGNKDEELSLRFRDFSSGRHCRRGGGRRAQYRFYHYQTSWKVLAEKEGGCDVSDGGCG